TLPFGRFFLQRRDIELAVLAMGDDAVRRACFTDIMREAAGIDAGDADQAARDQPVVERAGSAPVGGIGNAGADDKAVRRAPLSLDILVVEADIADMGEGEGDDLAGEGRVGQAFLIAGHRGIEADFANCLALDADAETAKYGP